MPSSELVPPACWKECLCFLIGASSLSPRLHFTVPSEYQQEVEPFLWGLGGLQTLPSWLLLCQLLPCSSCVQPPPWPPAGWGQLPGLCQLCLLFLKPLPIPAESGVPARRLFFPDYELKQTHKQVPRELVKGEKIIMVGRNQMTFPIKCLLCDLSTSV